MAFATERLFYVNKSTLSIGKRKDFAEGNMVKKIDGTLAGWLVILSWEDSARKITLEKEVQG